MPYVYILECSDKSYYTGSAWNLEKRLWEHQNGKGANYTSTRLPVRLVFYESFNRIEDAYRREKQIQGWSRRKKLALIESNFDKLVEYSKNYTQHGLPEKRMSTEARASTSSADDPTNRRPEPVEGELLD